VANKDRSQCSRFYPAVLRYRGDESSVQHNELGTENNGNGKSNQKVTVERHMGTAVEQKLDELQ
jgi:hypothetical protein